MGFEHRWDNSILKRIENRGSRDVILIGSDLFTRHIYSALLNLKIKVRYIVSDDSFFNKICIEEIKNENPENVFVLVAQYYGHREVYNLLLEFGFEFPKDFSLMGIGGYIESIDSIDSLLTYNRSNEKYPGIKVYGDEYKDNIKIVTLGNSTSDPYTGGISSWSEILYKELILKNPNITLYCAAMTGYSSTQEFLKFNRDVLNLEPNIVIMVSGYNDVINNSYVPNYPYLHKYQKRFFEFLMGNPQLAPDSMDMRNMSKVIHGFESNLADYEVWINNIRKIDSICKEFNIKFYPYLQPMVEYGDYIVEDDLKEIFVDFFGKEKYEVVQKNTIEFCENAKELMQKYTYIKDLTSIFQNETGIYYDTCHCNEKGNTIIADRIYKDIIKEVEIWNEKN